MGRLRLEIVRISPEFSIVWLQIREAVVAGCTAFGPHRCVTKRAVVDVGSSRPRRRQMSTDPTPLGAWKTHATRIRMPPFRLPSTVQLYRLECFDWQGTP